MVCIKESEDIDEVEWGSDDEGSGRDADGPSLCTGSSEVCQAGTSRSKLVSDFMDMGFSEDIVMKAIENNGEEDKEAILEELLTYSAIEKSSPVQAPIGCSVSEDEVFSGDEISDMDNYEEEDGDKNFSKNDNKFQNLVEMGFSRDEASAAIARCGPASSMIELADSIHASQMAKDYDNHLDETGCFDDPPSSNKHNLYHAFESHKRKKKCVEDVAEGGQKSHYQGRPSESYKKKNSDEEMPLVLPNPMVGFGVPSQGLLVTKRKLPEAAIGPPFFYYENVALAPKGVWDNISRFLYDVEPEFVDSKYFCAAARKRGYIHNLPIHNRFPLLPIPPQTISEALPMTKKWWPSWDPRTHLNCLQTVIASAKLTERIRKQLADSDDPPPHGVQQCVLQECRKWNLVWVGHHKVAPLETDEIEALLGFPKNHTRGGGISRTERYKSLGNSFQVDTVAYHLSVLKDIFPNGITVLSLFSGIGGAEVALHRLGIHLKTVVSVEISDVNRNIQRCWWEQTGQTGTLVDIADIQQLTGNRLEHLMRTFGGFDLVIGGSPCNNLAGSNRVSRDGLRGEQSSLFYDYCRVLDLVKCIMAKDS